MIRTILLAGMIGASVAVIATQPSSHTDAPVAVIVKTPVRPVSQHLCAPQDPDCVQAFTL